MNDAKLGEIAKFTNLGTGPFSFGIIIIAKGVQTS